MFSTRNFRMVKRMLVHELSEFETQVVDSWIDTKDPHGYWDFSFVPEEGLLERNYTIFYVLGKNGIVPYLYLAESFDELLDGLEKADRRSDVNLNDIQTIELSIWE